MTPADRYMCRDRATPFPAWGNAPRPRHVSPCPKPLTSDVACSGRTAPNPVEVIA